MLRRARSLYAAASDGQKKDWFENLPIHLKTVDFILKVNIIVGKFEMIDHAIETITNRWFDDSFAIKKIHLPTQQEFCAIRIFPCNEMTDICDIPILVHNFDIKNQIIASSSDA